MEMRKRKEDEAKARPSKAKIAKAVESYLDEQPSSWLVSDQKSSEKFTLTKDMAQNMARQVLKNYMVTKPPDDVPSSNDEALIAIRATPNPAEAHAEAPAPRENGSNDNKSENSIPIKLINKKEIINAANQWRLIDTYNSVKAEENRLEEQKEANLQKSKVAAQLTRQMQERKLVEKLEIQEKEKYRKEEHQRLDEWMKATQRIEQEEQQKTEELRQIRLSQVKDSKERQRREKEGLILEGEGLIRKCKAELEKQEQDRKRRQQEEVDRLRRSKEENLEQEKIRERIRLKEAEEEFKRIEEANLRQEAEDRRRRAQFDARVSRYEDYAKSMEANTHVQEKREENFRLDQKITREAKEREQNDLMREERDKAVLEEKHRMMALHNLRMAEEKKLLDLEQDKINQEYSTLARLDGERHQALEKQKHTEQKKSKKEYFKSLREQEQNNKQEKQKKSLDCMTSVEQQINRELLEKIYADESVHEKIAMKLLETEN